ncbi:MAG: MBL fold metallo-hydrolase [Nanoarchaeota archaeon]|nr:MBL fold metallo-hydrolase [Nanoarchaeota archaeon]
MLLLQLPIGKMKNFAYILADEKTKQAAVIDPGFDHKKILHEAEKHTLTIKKILLTHAHFDHVTDLPALVKTTKAEIYIHEKEPFQTELKLIRIKDGQIIKLGSVSIKAIHTPGHTLGSVCFLAKNKLFTGDTLFINSIGRTDYGGNEKQLFASLKKLSKLPDSTEIYPGHSYNGSKSTIKEQKKTNSFLKIKP